MTKYCKICAFCVKDGEYYCCIYQGRTKTERQICHTTKCHDFVMTANGNNIVTGKKYKPNSNRAMCNKFFTVERKPTFWERVKEFGRKFEVLKQTLAPRTSHLALRERQTTNNERG